MLDPQAGTYRLHFQREFQIAQRILAPFDGELVWATDDFVAFRYRDERACIAFYPHRINATTTTLRVRSQGSVDTRYAVDLMLRLDASAGYNPLFTHRGDRHGYNMRANFIAKTRTKPGWAAEGILR